MRARWLLVAAAACGSSAPALETKQLPGLTVGLPRGALAESPANTYAAGSIRLELFEHEDKRIDIRWLHTESPTSTIPEQPGVLRLAPPGLHGVTTTTQFGGADIYATVFICGDRAFTIASEVGRDTKRIHTAIVNSVTCTPAPTAAPPTLRAVDLQLPATFKPQPAIASAYPSTTWTDETTGVLISTTVVPDMRISPLYNLAREITKQLDGMTNIEVGDASYETTDAANVEWLAFSATPAGSDTRVHGYAVTTFCRDLRAHAVTLVISPDADAATRFLAIAQRATCRSSLN